MHAQMSATLLDAFHGIAVQNKESEDMLATLRAGLQDALDAALEVDRYKQHANELVGQLVEERARHQNEKDDILAHYQGQKEEHVREIMQLQSAVSELGGVLRVLRIEAKNLQKERHLFHKKLERLGEG